MQQSSRYKINYPSANRSDTADVPRDFASVVAGLEQSAMYGQGTLAARPTSSVGTPGIQGRFYMATDQTPHVLYYDFGTGWDSVGALTAGSVGTTQLADASVTEPKMVPGVGGGDFGTAFPTTGLFTGYKFVLFATYNVGQWRGIECIYRPDIDGTYPWFPTGDTWFLSTAQSSASVSLTALRTGYHNVRASVSGAQNGGSLTIDGSTRIAQSDRNTSVSVDYINATLEDGPLLYSAGQVRSAAWSGGSVSMSFAATPIKLQ